MQYNFVELIQWPSEHDVYEMMMLMSREPQADTKTNDCNKSCKEAMLVK